MGAAQDIRSLTAPVRYRMTVDEYLILEKAGAFEGKRTQLIDGEIYIVNAIHRPHSRAQWLLSIAVDKALLDAKSPLHGFAPVAARLDDLSLPEPDIVVATAEDEDFVSKSSIRIAMEISDSSLRFDLGRKAKLYARTGVPEYWVVDLKRKRIIQMWAPKAAAYSQRAEFVIGETIASATMPDIIVDTSRLA